MGKHHKIIGSHNEWARENEMYKCEYEIIGRPIKLFWSSIETSEPHIEGAIGWKTDRRSAKNERTRGT